jgi:hypothetical protein
MSIDLLLGKTRRSWCRGADHGSVGSDPLVWTPSAVRAELDRVRDVVDTINQEMSRAREEKKISDAEWRGWFRTYQTAHKLADKGSSLWGSNVLVARRHEQEAIRWRDIIRSRGASLIGPRDMGQPPPDPGSHPILLPLLAGVLATGFVAYKYGKLFGPRSPEPPARRDPEDWRETFGHLAPPAPPTTRR